MNQILLIIILIILSMFFSLSETAITAVSKIKVKRFLKEGFMGSKALYDLREHPNRMLSMVLLGNNLVNFGAVSLATAMVIDLLTHFSVLNKVVAVTTATAVMTAILLVFGEISPKVVAIKYCDRIALAVAPVIAVLSVIFHPFLMLINFVCKPIIKLFGADVKSNAPFVTEDELKMLLTVGEEEGVLEKDEKEMIHSIFEFGDSIAKEVMVPKPDMFCMEVSTPQTEALLKISEQAHSRIPVYEGTIDNIVGIVFAKDLLSLVAEGKGIELKQILHPVLFVPETKKLDDLLRQMQSQRTQIAVVVDEYGGVAGIVTLEDLLEEIVGEIKDEFDIEEKNVEIYDDGSAMVDARMTVSDVNEKLQTAIPDGEYDTIGGFVLSILGKLPQVGDRVRFEDLRLIVEKVAKRRITRIKIGRIKDDGSERESIVGG